MQRKWPTHFGFAGSVVHDRERELDQHHAGRDPVSVCPAVFGLCTPASLSLLFDLKGMLHRSTYLLLQVVVVVGRFSLLTLGVPFPVGVISCFFAVASAAASLCQAMTAEASAGRTVRAGANTRPDRRHCLSLQT